MVYSLESNKANNLRRLSVLSGSTSTSKRFVPSERPGGRFSDLKMDKLMATLGDGRETRRNERQTDSQTNPAFRRYPRACLDVPAGDHVVGGFPLAAPASQHVHAGLFFRCK